MTVPTVALPSPILAPEVHAFAAAKEISRYFPILIDLARQAFPSSALEVSLAQDAEDETHRYIAIDVEVGGRTTDELLDGQRAWSAGVARVCPSHLAVYFVLGWQ
jgi:hypothetical protein